MYVHYLVKKLPKPISNMVGFRTISVLYGGSGSAGSAGGPGGDGAAGGSIGEDILDATLELAGAEEYVGHNVNGGAGGDVTGGPGGSGGSTSKINSGDAGNRCPGGNGGNGGHAIAICNAFACNGDDDNSLLPTIPGADL